MSGKVRLSLIRGALQLALQANVPQTFVHVRVLEQERLNPGGSAEVLTRQRDLQWTNGVHLTVKGDIVLRIFVLACSAIAYIDVKQEVWTEKRS